MVVDNLRIGNFEKSILITGELNFIFEDVGMNIELVQ